MANDLNPIVERLEALIANLSTAERRRLSTDVARSLRGSQAQRIRDNKNPDGTPFAAKKSQPQLRKRRGSLRMFNKMQRTRWLKPKGTASAAGLTFTGFADQIARVNQYGLRDQVNKNGTQYKYPVRELLGFTNGELETVEEIIIKHLTK